MSCQEERCRDLCFLTAKALPSSVSAASPLGRTVVLGLSRTEKSSFFSDARLCGLLLSGRRCSCAPAHHAQLRAEQLHLSGEAGEDAEVVRNSACVPNEGFVILCM